MGWGQATGAGAWAAFVMGGSSGGIRAASRVLSGLPAGLDVPVVLLLHRGEDSTNYLCRVLAGACELPVRPAEEKLPVERGTVYLGPPGYHLLVEEDETFSLSFDVRVNCSRPSIDVLFESAADTWRERLIGVLLTGANADGAIGVTRIRERGGYVIVQDPEDSEASRMPRAAIETGAVHEVLPLAGIGPRLAGLARRGRTDPSLRGAGRDAG